MKKKILDKLVGIYLILFWFAGNIGILRILDFFLPGWTWLASIVTLLLSGGAIYYSVFRPDEELRDSLKAQRHECQQMEDAIEDAIWQRSVTPLFPVCDHDFLQRAMRDSSFWKSES